LKVLVTGATGFLGGYVVDELVTHGHEVHAAVRSGSDTNRLDRSGVRKRAFDLTDPSGMGEAVRDMEAVVHLAAYYTFTGRKDLYQRLNVDATAALVDACKERGVGHFIYCSSSEAIGPVQGLGDETSELHPQFEYGRSKVKAEQKVRERVGPSMAWTIVRPSGIYGPGNVDDISFWTIVSYGKSGATRRVVGSGRNLIQFVHAKDVAWAFRLILEARDKAKGQIYMVSDVRPYTYEEIYTLLSELKGVPPPQGHIPAILAKALIAPVQLVDRLRGRDNFLMRTSTVDVLTSDRAYSIDKARRDLGYVPQIDLRRGLEETISWYRKNGFL
jgi:nucleoside-diphosphate-sugar epimerase